MEIQTNIALNYYLAYREKVGVLKGACSSLKHCIKVSPTNNTKNAAVDLTIFHGLNLNQYDNLTT
jgi:hypothetical protein